ncbi:hypothetical protein D5086_001334 [Populus alba]|uniref:Uncharacterized protein n=1 Tax=Populus alba TaxID=43335 RepID=A0ACC4CZS5_POPAL
MHRDQVRYMDNLLPAGLKIQSDLSFSALVSDTATKLKIISAYIMPLELLAKPLVSSRVLEMNYDSPQNELIETAQ